MTRASSELDDRPVDPFEKAVLTSSLLDEDHQFGTAVLAVGIWVVIAFQYGFAVLVPSTVVVFLLSMGWLKLQMSVFRRLASMHSVNPGLRGLVAFGFAILPLVALLAIGIIATSGGT